MASDGLNRPQEILDYVEEHTDLNVVAITDHDEIEGAHEAREIWQRGHYSFDLVLGEEITTLSGHLLALDIEQPIRMFQSLERTIAEIHHQGGLAIVPHPLAWFSSGLRRWRMDTIMDSNDPHVYFDGLETFNPSFAGRQVHTDTIDLNNVYQLASLGGSDSHCLQTIGTARTIFAGSTWQDLRRCIVERSTSAEGEFWSFADHSSIAVPQAMRSLIILPGKRIRKMAGWFLADHGLVRV